MSEPTDHRCEVCGQPATVLVADHRETEPADDGKGGKWRAWAVTSTHAFCAAHQRRPECEYLPTTTPADVAKMEAASFWHRPVAAARG